MLFLRILLELVVQKCIESDVVIIKDGSKRVATRPRGARARGEERVMNWLRQELVRGLSEVEDIDLGDWDEGLLINNEHVKVGLCLRDSPDYYLHDLVKGIGVKTYLILVQLPNEDAYQSLYLPFETTEINEEWELCHVTKGFRRWD